MYYRLNVLSLQVVPLRDRRKDIPLLIDFFLNKFNSNNLKLTKEVVIRLYNYSWPGNIRELKNCIEAVTETCQEKVTINDLPS
ncbi:hypothetical protein JCM15060_22290 [Halanaerobaculum tunisiense]